jgi:pyruvate,orthophosphate dikinase
VLGRKGKELDEKKKLLARVEQLHEFNPMLGHRGVRLGSPIPKSPRCRPARSSRRPAA